MQLHALTATSVMSLVSIMAANVTADVLNVPSAEYPTIQSAIDAASNGDTVLVASGTYPEAIDFLGKEITVESEEGSANTILDGKGIEVSLVTCTSGETANSVLRGFNLFRGKRGTEDFNPPTFVGGGMYIDDGSPTLEDVRFTSCSSDTGGGLYAIRSNSVLTDCIFYRCSAKSNSGAAQIFYNGVEFNNCVFEENWCTSYGGAIHAIHGDHAFYNCTFTSNGGPWWDPSVTYCDYGGALTWFTWTEGPRMTLANCTLDDNRCKLGGGGLWVSPGFDSIDVIDTSICFNADNNVSGRVTNMGGNTLCDCEGDFNLDGLVNGADLSILLGFWGLCNSDDCAPDINFDGVIDGYDLAYFLALWGTCPVYSP